MKNTQACSSVKSGFVEKPSIVEASKSHLLHDLMHSVEPVVIIPCFIGSQHFIKHVHGKSSFPENSIRSSSCSSFQHMPG